MTGKKLQEVLKQEERAEVREIILMFLLQNDRKSHRKIAEFIGGCLKTLGYWFRESPGI